MYNNAPTKTTTVATSKENIHIHTYIHIAEGGKRKLRVENVTHFKRLLKL